MKGGGHGGGGLVSIDNIERDKPMGSSTLLESELEEKGRRGKEGEREG